LSLKGKKKRKHNRNLSDAALGDLLNKISYKCAWYGSVNHQIDQYAPTTKKCWNTLPDGTLCEYEWDKPIPTNVRTLKCPKCGAVLDRDVNAAKGILITAHREMDKTT